MQTQERENEHDNDDQTDKVNDPVHDAASSLPINMSFMVF
jgi:hypothetical protein